MLSKLPKWVEYGAFLLAFTAGVINAVGLLGFEHQSVSHLSGSATLLGAQLSEFSFSGVWHLTSVILAFFIGASCSGLLLANSHLALGKHYDTALIIEAAAILLAFFALQAEANIGHLFASFACGLQNALVTTYSGAVVRTTHITGIVTDLGIMLGSYFRGQKFDKRKLWLFLLIVSGFILGGSMGAWLFTHWQFKALLLPAGICLLLAIAYKLMVRSQTKLGSDATLKS